MRAIVDLHSLSEDERIQIIGKTAMASEKPVAFMVDADTLPDGKGKAARYISKLAQHFPNLRVIKISDGPVADVTTVEIGK